MNKTLFFLLFLSSLLEAQKVKEHNDKDWYHKDTININTKSLQKNLSTGNALQKMVVFNPEKTENIIDDHNLMKRNRDTTNMISSKIILYKPSLGSKGFFRAGKIYRDNFTNKIYFENRADRTLIYSGDLK